MSDDAPAVRRLAPEELPGVLRRQVQSFGGPLSEQDETTWAAALEAGLVWGAEAPGEGVLAQCTVTSGIHWFAGGGVACQRIGAVAVAPEHRGRGLGGALVRDAVRRGAADGLGLSLLYPATTAMYRSLGWEHAGTFARFELPTRPVPPLGPPLPLADPPDWEAVQTCHERFARTVNGAGQRSPRRWERIRRETELAYTLAADHGDLQAYALVRHQRDGGDWRYVLDVLDWAALTPTGLAALVGFVGRHGTLARAARLSGPVARLWPPLLPEQDLRTQSSFSWMARGLDLATAVAQRGFPPGLATAVTFSVDDALLPTAHGPWRLEVRDGTGRLDPTEHAEVRLHARAVGPLFTGHGDAATLALAGLASGDDTALAALSAAFAAPPPSLIDFF